ncbi:MAG: 7-cyano-7-deazaguanine synthase [Candidatus Nitrosocaldaceae archaeon]|nr:MAG: 7-cyano-7-deazaguanine synthase [Candidatus Nitrosocaldaceae archaeon]
MKAICIFSGGLDSISTAAYLKEQGYQLYLLTFNYGQRATKEVRVAEEFGNKLGAEHKIIDISFMKELYGKSNVLTYHANIPSKFDYSIVVPVRNAVFLTIASAWAFSINANLLAYGAHKDDKNYPDCRREFAKALEEALNLAEEDGIKQKIREKIEIWSPAIEGFDKKDLISIGYKILGSDIFKSWSCYSDNDKHCGICESCINRKRAFKNAKIKDETDYLNMDNEH